MRVQLDIRGGNAFDKHGNMTKLGSVSLGYDSLDRHVSTTLANGTTITVERDVDGEVLARTVTGSNPETVKYSTGVVMFLLDANNTVTGTSQSLPGGMSVTTVGATSTSTFTSLRGEACLTVKGGVVTRTRFDPFGTPLTAIPDVLPGTLEPGFGTEAGKLTDTLTPYGLIEMGSRLYSSVLGRFLQVDPVPGGGVNAYAYPPDPINANDYSGNTVAILGGPFIAELGAGVGAMAVAAAEVAPLALAVGLVAGLFYLSSSNRETRVSIPRVDLARYRKAANVTIPRPGLAPKLDRNGKIYKVYEILTDSHWTVWKYGITSKLGSGGGSTRPQSQLPRCQRDTGAKCTWNWDSDAEYNYSGARAREFELISEYRSLRGYCPLGQMFSCK